MSADDNDSRDQKLYRYDGSKVLRNKLNIRAQAKLNQAERRLVRQRMEEGLPRGDFDQKHLQAIHRHLFQDVYRWAGQFRQVNIAKGPHWFLPHDRLTVGMRDIHKRLKARKFLKGLDRQAFAREAGQILGDINFLHPFREGNGRTQLQFLKLLGERAGHTVDLTRLDGKRWIEASIQANNAEYDLMSRCIHDAITGPAHERSGSGIDHGRE